MEGVSVAYDGTTVLGPVSACVDAGAWLALIGPNGAGKTSMLHAAAGLVDHRGTVRVGGRSLGEMGALERARLVALVPQRPMVPDDMSVLEYALLGRNPHIRRFGFETDADRAVVALALERLQLAPFADRLLGNLSGGELQRVLLARALAQQAPVLLLDEPTSALDLGHQQQVLRLVDELRTEYHLTVLTTMHDLTLAGSYADTLMLLDEGQVVAQGPAAAVLTPDTLRRHYHTDVEVVRASDGTLAVIPLRTPAPVGEL
jgi:iron complex transport system ATP-binding protein